jgi:hypothetical protein
MEMETARINTREEKLILLENLLQRMEYNEKNNYWKLSGSITRKEREAIRSAMEVYKESIIK